MEKLKNAVLAISVVLALAGILASGVMFVISMEMLNSYKSASARLIQAKKQIEKRDKVVNIIVGQMQRVQSLRDVDIILARLKLKRVAVPVKERKNELAENASSSEKNTRKVAPVR